MNDSVAGRKRKVKWGCWFGEKEKGFCCKHVECEQAAEINADKQLEMRDFV